MLMRATVLCATFLGATAFIAQASRAESVPMRASFDRFPMQIGDWRGAALPPFEPNILRVLGVDDYVTRVYYDPQHSALGLYIGYYQSQRQGDSIHSPLNCLPGAGWEPMKSGYMTIPVSDGKTARDVSVNRYVIQKGMDRQLVLYWYQSHGRVVANEYWSKLYLIKDAAQLNRTDAALVRVIVPIDANADNGEEVAAARGTAFVKTMFPLLPEYLPS
jgi:EpsI family protein